MTPFWKVYHFAGYMRRQTDAIFFDYPSAVAFCSDYRAANPDKNGCYITAFYPERIAA